MLVIQELSFFASSLPTLIWRLQTDSKWQGKLIQKALGLLESSQRSILWIEELTPNAWFLIKKSSWEWVSLVSRTEHRKILSTKSACKKPSKRKKCTSALILFIQVCRLELLESTSSSRSSQVFYSRTSSTHSQQSSMKSEKSWDRTRKTWKNMAHLSQVTKPKKCNWYGRWSSNSFDLMKTKLRVNLMQDKKLFRTTSVVHKNPISKGERKSNGNSISFTQI